MATYVQGDHARAQRMVAANHRATQPSGADRNAAASSNSRAQSAERGRLGQSF